MGIINVTLDTTNKHSGTTLSNNNLTATTSSTTGGVRSTHGKTKGKWYCEFSSPSAGWFSIGVISSTLILSANTLALTQNANVRLYTPNSKKKSPEYTSYGETPVANEIYSILLDLDSGTIEFWKSGVSQGVSHTNLSSLTNPVYIYVGNVVGYEAQPVTANFGNTSFAYPIPNGYNAYGWEGVDKILLSSSDGSVLSYKDKMYQSGVSYFKFDELSGDVYDSKGTVKGTVTGTTRVSGISGNALSFNGTNSDYVVFDSKVIPIGEKSIRFKIKKNELPTSTQCLFRNVQESAYHGEYYSINSSGNIIVLSYRGGGSARYTLTSSMNVCDGQWHDVLLTWDGTIGANGVKLYIDDMEKHDVTGTALVTETLVQQLNLTTIPSYQSYFKGELDELEIYNKVIDASVKTGFIKLSSHTERDFINYGVSLSELQAIDTSSDSKHKKYIQSTTTVLGTGKVFEHVLDTNKVLKKITIK